MTYAEDCEMEETEATEATEVALALKALAAVSGLGEVVGLCQFEVYVDRRCVGTHSTAF